MSKTFKSAAEGSSRALTVNASATQGSIIARIQGAGPEANIRVSNNDAPALALAILEAAGVKPSEDFKEYGSPQHLDDIAFSLSVYILKQEMAAESAAKEAADREALEAEALKLYGAYFSAVNLNDPPLCLPFNDLDEVSKHAAIALARTARAIHGGTK